MATFDTLPIELIIKIIAIAVNEFNVVNPPKIGLDASFHIPHSTGVYSAHLLLRSAITQAFGTENVSVSSCSDSEKPQRGVMEPFIGLYPMATTLRRVNRTFCEICTPMVYRCVNLLIDIVDRRTLDRITHHIIPYSHHIHILYIYVDCISSYLSWDVQNGTANILSDCTQLTTLGLYYHHGSGWPRVAREVVLLAEKGRLAHIGIYLCLTRVYPTEIDVDDLGFLIQGLLESQRAREAIRTLELAMDGISMQTFLAIRSYLPSLRSLSLKSTLRLVLDAKWDRDPQKYWVAGHNIRRLQLVACKKGFTSHIQFLVHLLPALTELFICGIATKDSPPTWNRRPQYPSQTRKPLELFHIENMDEQEIVKVTRIPTMTLIATAVRVRCLVNVLTKDPDSFPGMESLRFEPLSQLKFGRYRNPRLQEELFRLCHERAIEIRQDAVPIFYFDRDLRD